MTREEFDQWVAGEAVRLSSAGIRVAFYKTIVNRTDTLLDGRLTTNWLWEAIINPSGFERDVVESAHNDPEECLAKLRENVREVISKPAAKVA